MAISELPRFYRWYFPAAKRHRFLVGSYGPSGSWWLRDRIQGRIEILLSTRLLAATPENDRVRLSLAGAQGPLDLQADHVIAGTGYDVDVARLAYLDPEIIRRIECIERAPVLNIHFESSVPGLHFTGPLSFMSFGPLFRFAAGAEISAPRLARRLSQ